MVMPTRSTLCSLPQPSGSKVGLCNQFWIVLSCAGVHHFHNEVGNLSRSIFQPLFPGHTKEKIMSSKKYSCERVDLLWTVQSRVPFQCTLAMFRKQSLDICGFFFSSSHNIFQVTVTKTVNALSTSSHFILGFNWRQFLYTQKASLLSLPSPILKVQGAGSGAAQATL